MRASLSFKEPRNHRQPFAAYHPLLLLTPCVAAAALLSLHTLLSSHTLSLGALTLLCCPSHAGCLALFRPSLNGEDEEDGGLGQGVHFGDSIYLRHKATGGYLTMLANEFSVYNKR